MDLIALDGVKTDLFAVKDSTKLIDKPVYEEIDCVEEHGKCPVKVVLGRWQVKLILCVAVCLQTDLRKCTLCV